MDVRADYERLRKSFIHRHRINGTFRRQVRAGVWGAAALLLAGTWLLRRFVDGGSDGLLLALVGAGVVATVLALTRPAAPPHAHDLPGAPDGPCEAEAKDLGQWVIAARWAGAAALIAFAVNLPDWVVLAVLAVVAVAAGRVIAYRLWVWRRTAVIATALRAHGPRFAIAYSGHGGGPTHLSMWEAPLRSSGFPGVVFNFRESYCAYLRENTDLGSPFVQVSTDPTRDLRHLIVPGLGAFFYVHNAWTNLRFMSMSQVKHIWLGHGDSDKPGSALDRHRLYDLLVVSGEAAIDRYADAGVRIPAEKFVVLGRPQVVGIESATRDISSVERPVVFYAPTWQGKKDAIGLSSLELGADIVRALATRADVIFRPHPVSIRFPSFKPLVTEIDAILAADTADPATPGKHVWGELPNRTWSVVDCMNRSDALVSDVSSVVSDWLQSGKPFAMVSPQWDAAEFREKFSVARAAYVLLGDLSNVTAVLDDMLRDDSMRDERMEQRTKVLGGFDGNGSAEAFAAYFHEMFSRFHARR